MGRLYVVLGVLVIALAAAAVASSRPRGPARIGDTSPVTLKYDGGKVKISNHGNIVQWESPAGYDHFGAVDKYEGYVVCYNGPDGFTAAFDIGASEDVFGARTGSGATFVRKTNGANGDGGALQLTQKFSYSTATRTMTIKHTLKNLSDMQLTGLTFRRHADFNVDTGGANGWNNFKNHFVTDALDQVTAYNTRAEANVFGKTSHSISIRHGAEPASFGHFARVLDFPFDASCTGDSSLNPDNTYFEDDAASMIYIGDTLNPGKAVTLTTLYNR
jgi:hypothetical protein